MVYLGLRALLLGLSVWGFYDLQHATRGNEKDTVLVGDISILCREITGRVKGAGG